MFRFVHLVSKKPFLSKTDKIRFAHYRIWKQIDIIGYLNGSTSSKFVSASFKSFTFGAECISMWPLCSYRINLNISCWLIKTLSSKYNTSINLMTYFSSRSTGRVRISTRRRLRLFDTSPYYGICICRDQTWKAETKIRNRNFEFSEKALESEFELFPTTTNIGAICINGDQWPPTRWSIWNRSVPMATRPSLVTSGSLGCRW